jgi:hypothetical protein
LDLNDIRDERLHFWKQIDKRPFLLVLLQSILAAGRLPTHISSPVGLQPRQRPPIGWSEALGTWGNRMQERELRVSIRCMQRLSIASSLVSETVGQAR